MGAIVRTANHMREKYYSFYWQEYINKERGQNSTGSVSGKKIRSALNGFDNKICQSVV